MPLRVCREARSELPLLLRPPGPWILLMRGDVAVATANRSLILRETLVEAEPGCHVRETLSCAMLPGCSDGCADAIFDTNFVFHGIGVQQTAINEDTQHFIIVSAFRSQVVHMD